MGHLSLPASFPLGFLMLIYGQQAESEMMKVRYEEEAGGRKREGGAVNTNCSVRRLLFNSSLKGRLCLINSACVLGTEPD